MCLVQPPSASDFNFKSADFFNLFFLISGTPHLPVQPPESGVLPSPSCVGPVEQTKLWTATIFFYTSKNVVSTSYVK